MDREQIQQFYEETYNYGNSNQDQFDSYERNEVLKRIYSEEQGRILDLGAGNGKISKFFLSKGYEVHALEWTHAGVEKLTELGVNAQVWDLENTPYLYEDGFFDQVFWGDNVEHLFFPESVAKEIYRILKPGGRLVLSTPNHGWIVNRIYYLLKGVPRRTEGQKIPIWRWQHIRYFNRATMHEFLEYCGFNQDFKFYAAERRQPFAALSRFFPSLFGSVMVVTVTK